MANYRIIHFSCLVLLFHISLSGCSAAGGSQDAGVSGGGSTGTGSGHSTGAGNGSSVGNGSGAGSGTSSGTGAADAGMDVFQPPPDSFSIDFPTRNVPPGWETTECIVKRITNPTQIR